MLIQILGKGYIVWDKAAHIDFIKPGRGTVTAKFAINKKQIEKIIANTAAGQKYLLEFAVDIKDQASEKVARVLKKLYIRGKNY
jgi:hypothetical protein